MATSVHEHMHDHVNVDELRPARAFGVDVVVDVHMNVVGFLIWLRLGSAVTQWFIPWGGGRRTM